VAYIIEQCVAERYQDAKHHEGKSPTFEREIKKLEMEKLELLKKLNEYNEKFKPIQNSISPAYKEGIARDYLSAKIITWGANDSITVKIYDTKTRKSESFNLDASIPNAAEGTMVFNKLYLTGGHGPVKCSYEIDSIRK